MKLIVKTCLSLLVLVAMLSSCATGGNSQPISGRSRPYFREAQIFLQQNNFERALEYYQLVLEHDPEHVESMKNVADLYFLQAELTEGARARELFGKAHEYYTRTLNTMQGMASWESYDDFDVYKSDSELKLLSIFARNFGQGREAYQEDELEDAAEIFYYLRELYPDRIESIQMLAAIANKQGDVDKAIGYFLVILEVDPTNIVVMSNLAVEYQRLNDYENAIKYFQMFIDTEPENVTGYTSLAYIHLERNDFDAALILYEQAMHVDPENVDLVADAAGIAQNANNFEKVIVYLKRLVDLERVEQNVSRLVNYLAREQNWQEVLTYSKIWHELNPEAKDPVQFIVVAAYQVGDQATAREFQEILNRME